MISVIICSRTGYIPKGLSQNISDTVGCDFEIVVMDNSQNDYSIFSAYNEGVRRSMGNILCFCHEDILFRSDNWGELVQDLLADTTIGAIGVIGTHFLPKAPMYWWCSPYISQYSINTDNGASTLNDTRDFFRENIADVAAIDGVCFFAPKAIFSTVRFDDRTFSGFHAYDMDFSMQVQKAGKRVCVTDVLTIEHFWSEDSFSNPGYLAKLDAGMELFYNKWKDSLPIVRGLDEPQIVIDRLNNLCIQAYDAKRVRQSKAYKLGRLLLKPIKVFKK